MLSNSLLNLPSRLEIFSINAFVCGVGQAPQGPKDGVFKHFSGKTSKGVLRTSNDEQRSLMGFLLEV